MASGNEVLAHVRAMREAIGYVIAFSRGHDNWAGGSYVESDAISRYLEDQRKLHDRWSEEYDQALDALDQLGYPVSPQWWKIPAFEPQVAFSEVPRKLYSDGTVDDRTVWVIGSGDNHEGEALPDYLERELKAGQHLEADEPGEEGYPETVAGAFDGGIVDQWEAVFDQLQDIERRLFESKLNWRDDEQSATPVDQPAPPPSISERWVLDPENKMLTLDGKPLRLTAKGCVMVEALVAANGDWVSGWTERGISKPSEVKKALPRLVGAKIETESGKGYRIKKTRQN